MQIKILKDKQAALLLCRQAEDYETLEQYITTLGGTAIRLAVVEANKQVLPFWNKMGFNIVDTRGDRADQMHVMEKSL